MPGSFFSVPEYLADGDGFLTRELVAQDEKLRRLNLSETAAQITRLECNAMGFEITDGAVRATGGYKNSESAETAKSLAHALAPWRKGPFMLGNTFIDAEWRSDHKWNRLAKDLPELTDLTVADVGCNNGYYLYRIAAAGARHALGLDPTLKYWLQFRLAEVHIGKTAADFLPLGWQALQHMPESFDVIFLMGVNYHDSNPLEMLHTCRRALKPGGLIICESVVVPGESDLEIFPEGKYAGIGGVYAIPTARALVRQLASVGFQNVRVQHTAFMTVAEQRRTEFSPQPSLSDHVAANGWSKEGYPPLARAALFAYR